MIITGAARSVAVKLAYQSGLLLAPLTMTLLYLFGQSLSLVVYWIEKRGWRRWRRWRRWSANRFLLLFPRTASRRRRPSIIGAVDYASVPRGDAMPAGVGGGGGIEMRLRSPPPPPRRRPTGGWVGRPAEMGECCRDGGEEEDDDGGGEDATSSILPAADGGGVVPSECETTTQSVRPMATGPPPPPVEKYPPSVPCTSSSDSASPASSSSVVEHFQSYFYDDEDDEDDEDDDDDEEGGGGGGIPNGSRHGLSDETEERTRVAARGVPWCLKPAIPALLNLLNSGLRWASLLYVDASVAEMLISGLELTLGAVAARALRGRKVVRSRWAGVAIVAVGVAIVERANRGRHVRTDEDSDGGGNGDAGGARRPRGGSHASDATIGVALIVLQSTLSVLQDVGEEIFMQSANFPATKMLGMEGVYGFVVGVVAYAVIVGRGGGDWLRSIEDVGSTLTTLRENANARQWAVCLPLLFLVTGIFNIKATEATSAMTRNVWKNVRTVLVWVASLCIFYLGRDADYGEEWHTPESAYILLGFTVMSELRGRQKNSLFVWVFFYLALFN